MGKREGKTCSKKQVQQERMQFLNTRLYLKSKTTKSKTNNK